MPQLAPIVQPVIQDFDLQIRKDLVLDPLGTKDGLTSFSGGIRVTNTSNNEVTIAAPTAPALQASFTVSLSRPSKTSRISKVRVKLVVPVAATDLSGNPTQTKSHENSADITFLFSEKSTLAERELVSTALDRLLDLTELRQVSRELKSFY